MLISKPKDLHRLEARVHRQADLRKPQCRRLAWCAVSVAENDPGAFIRTEQVECNIAAADQP